MVITHGGSGQIRVQFGDTVLDYENKKLEYSNKESKKSFLITGPGEYEVEGVFMRGIAAGSDTIYTANLEGMNICFLGFALETLPQNAKQDIDGVDILFVSADSYKLAVSLEPSIMIPINYTDVSLKTFLKEGGADVKPIDKLTLKKKDLEGKEGDIVVLESQ